MPDPVTVAALKLAEILAPDLVKAGARRVKRDILGTPVERGMRDVYERAIADLLVEVGEARIASGGAPDPEAINDAQTVLKSMCSDDETAGLLLNITLRPGPVPVEALRGRAAALGCHPDSFPIPFDSAMRVLADKVWVEFLEEARQENSRIQPIINEANTVISTGSRSRACTPTTASRAPSRSTRGPKAGGSWRMPGRASSRPCSSPSSTA